jgi:hypothetical protein
LPEHGKIYYKLAPAGLFYLLSGLGEDEVTFENLKLYSKDIFFEIFVYPILEESFFYRLSSSKILHIFIEYFRSICKEIKVELKILEEIKKNGFYEVPSINWSYLLNYNPQEKDSPYYNLMQEWLYFMKSDKYLQWLDNKNLKKENIDSISICFSTKDDKLVLKINEIEEKAILEYNGNGLGSVNIRKYYHDFVLYNTRYQSIDQYFVELGPKLLHNINSLIFQLSLSIVKISCYKYECGPWESKRLGNLEKDLKILGNNKKMINAFRMLKNNLDNYFDEFLTYSKGEKEEEK